MSKKSVHVGGAALLAAAGLQFATASSAPAAVVPAFVQQVGTEQGGVGSLSVTPTAALGAGNRLIVEVGIWSSGNATATKVSDSTGDVFTELSHIVAGDGTETSVWTAPVTAGAGAKPAITSTASANADIGMVALEYTGLSAATGTGSVDVSTQSVGTTSTAATVSSGATAAAGANNEVALGFYNDSGFGTALKAGTGFTQRANVSPNGNMDLLVEDQAVQAGVTPNAQVATGANTYWMMATIVFQSATQSVPGAPTDVVASPGDGSAQVTWTPGPGGGSTITGYTVTPYMDGQAQTSTTVTGNPAPASTTVSGLTNGMSYTFTVAATNGLGTGPASAASNAVTPSTNPGGTWSAVQTWPIEPLAMHLLYNGETVSWDGWQQPQPSVVWNPAQPYTFSTINAPDSVFCDGAADLPDGRLLVIGGYGGLSTGQIGIVDTNIFDPATNSWTRVADMHYPRWYPTVTELADGRYVAISGNSTDANTWANTPEVYDPTTNTWTVLSKVNTSAVNEVEYPFSYEVPNGDVFVIGPEEDNSHLLDVNNQTWTSVGSAGMYNGSSIMYRPGKILYSGGARYIDTPSTAQNTTAVIDLTASTPTWRQTAPMNQARIYHTLVMLADGTVLAVGGSDTSDQQVITTGVLPTEIWNPDNERWTPAAPIAAARNYHSTAVLLPDGRVLVAGGGHPTGLQDAGQYSSQIYSPAYLSEGPRPTITSAPAAATYGSTIPITSPDASGITAVNLVSLGADTHQIDMNQHFVPLSFAASGGTLNVSAPAAAALAPPGYYMLFILKNGVPSVASMIHLGSAQTQTVPAQPSNVVASAGNGSATVSWTAPADGNTPITNYTITPYANGTALFPTTVSGTPPTTTATIDALTNGTSYTFTASATNAVGAGPASAPSNPVTPSATPPPAYRQSVSTQTSNVSSLSIAPTDPVATGDRLIVEVGVWNSVNSTATAVTDSAGNTYTKLTSFTGADGTEMSIWSAPITAGGGTAPTVTAQVGAKADVGMTVLEYSGLSGAAGSGALDVQAHATGTTGSAAATVGSGATPAATAAGELALGFYADSGFGTALTAGSGWTARANLSPNGNMDLLSEDQPVAAGATPGASVGTGAHTIWLAATLVFKAAAAAPPTVPGAPSAVRAAAGNAAATVTWTAPADGGSTITSYTVTPYLGTVAQPSTTVAGTATSVTINGLTNGSSYNFTVTATNAVGTGAASTLSNTVVPTATPPPAFVQQVSSQAAGRGSLAVAPSANLTSGDRLVVEVGVWNAKHSTTSSVVDSAGDTFTELTHFTAADGTELSVWSAPVTAGGGSRPTITATPSAAADIGVAAVEYAGLSATSAVDVSSHAVGTTSSGRSVSSGSTAATTAGNELAVGFYADSGFGTKLAADPGYTARVNLSPNGTMDLLVQDAVVAAGATPAPSVGTGPNTVWLAATVVFRSG